LLVDVLTHAADAPEPHTICPIGHRHVPDWQVAPPGHARPHIPQFIPSVIRLMQAAPHIVRPDPQRHMPDWQV
jgi:hypothetical protein